MPETGNPITPPAAQAANLCWKLARFLYARLDLLMALLLALITLFLYRNSPLPADVATIDFTDDSWKYDLLAKAQQHIWLGKDVLFTYGPLFQLLFVPIFWMRDLSLGEFYRLSRFVPIWATIVLVYGAARFLLPQVEPWKRAFYFLLLVIFWARFDIKLCVPLFVFAAFLWMQENLPAGALSMTAQALAAALLITLSFLIAADAGFYALAGFLLVAGSYSTYRVLHRQPWRPGVIFSGLTLLVFFVCMLAVNALFGRFADFRYWIGNYDLVSNYRWFEPMAISHQATSLLVTAALLSFSVFFWAWIVSKRYPENPGLRPRILAIALLSLLLMQSCIVRSSWKNVTLGLFPVIAFAFSFLFGALSRERAGLSAGIPPLLALVCTIVFAASPYDAFSAARIWRALTIPAAATCTPGKQLLDQACLAPDDFQQLNAGSRFLREHAAPSESVMIYPFENIYGDVARRRVAGGTLQSYVAADDFSLQQHLGGVERDHPMWAIYSADYLGSWTVDGISHFTRTPEVWLYLHRHFHRVANLELGVLGLQRDEERMRRWNLEVTKLPLPPARQPVKEGENIRLAQLNSWPQQDVDFLKLRIQVHYPPWWRVLKPATMNFFLQRADGTVKVAHAIAHPNRSYEVWIYPWSEPGLMNYFFENPSEWRKRGERPPITEISVRFDREDWVSVLPTEVELEEVDAERVSLR
ncbi:MAG TPA: hypothetical protein VK738_11960 [Terriglobales bacterium]|nr:hypothetical protein [Terriglobales bacterium]